MCLWHVLSECYCCESLSSPVTITMWSSRHIPALCCSWEVASQQLLTHSRGDAISGTRPPLPLSWFHRHCPSPGFQRLLWAPGSCQKSFSSQSPHRCQPMAAWEADAHVMVCSQWLTPTTAHFLEGKYIQRAWTVLFLISLVENKRQSNTFLQQCLNITLATCATLRGVRINKNVDNKDIRWISRTCSKSALMSRHIYGSTVIMTWCLSICIRPVYHLQAPPFHFFIFALGKKEHPVGRNSTKMKWATKTWRKIL